MHINEHNGGEAFGDTSVMKSLDLGGGNTTTNCKNEEKCDTAKYECTDEGILDCNDSMRIKASSMQKVCMKIQRRSM